jgi:drug/metabolite transporter (DMT)-like permease
MASASPPAVALSRAAFATLLLIAFMMGANHVAARLAFDDGVSVATAVVFRSGVTALVVGLILLVYRVPVRLQAHHRKALPAIGLLVGVQSLCLYASVPRPGSAHPGTGRRLAWGCRLRWRLRPRSASPW